MQLDTPAQTRASTLAPLTLTERAGWLVYPVAIALGSRLFSALLLSQYARQALRLPLLTDDTSPFVAWDGQWYLSIARFGYHATPLQDIGPAGGHHDFAFYPGWPALIRALSLNGLLPMDATAVVLANFLFVLAAIVVYRFFADRFDSRVAFGGTLLLAFNPAAYAFSMAYTEPLFVLLVGLCFLNRYGRLSPVFGALSVLVRVSGLAVGASAAAMFVIGKAPRLRALLIAAAIGLAFAAWWIFIWRLTGQFDGWLLGSASWMRDQGYRSILHDYELGPTPVVLWMSFIALLIAGCLSLVRRHPDLAIFGLVAITLTLIGAPASSMPRHSMIAFPAFAAIADRIGGRASVLLAIAFAAGQVLFVSFAFGPNHFPP